MRRALSAALIAASALSATPAIAGPFEVEGVGPSGIAEISARVARADDGAAAFQNPGGLGLGRGLRIEIAPTLGVSGLSAQGKNRPLEDPFGIALTFDATMPLTGLLKDRIRVGLAAYFPPTTALRLIARPRDEPLFPYYDNRTQRLVIIPALGLRITKRIGVGVGINVLGGVSGPATVIPGASGAPESRLDLQATTTLAVNVGARIDVTQHVRLGATFRQRFAVPAAVTTKAEIAGVPLDVTVTTRSALYDPLTVVVGASFDFASVELELDAIYARWSEYAGPFVAVRAELPGLAVASPITPSLAKDTVSLRSAGVYRVDIGRVVGVALRWGLGFEPSMLRSTQQSVTNLVDGNKLLAGAGASVEVRGVIGKALRFGFGVNAQALMPYEQEKKICARTPCPEDSLAGPDPLRPSRGVSNPGFPKLTGNGVFVAGSLGIGVDL